MVLREQRRNHPLAALVSWRLSLPAIRNVQNPPPLLTQSISNIRMGKEKPLRDGKPCPKNRDEPFEKIEITDQILQLAGVKPY